MVEGTGDANNAQNGARAESEIAASEIAESISSKGGEVAPAMAQRGTATEVRVAPLLIASTNPEDVGARLVALDSLGGLENVMRRRPGRPEIDRARFEAAAEGLRGAMELFNDAETLEEVLKIDPEGKILTAFGDYTASAIAFMRDLLPDTAAAKGPRLVELVCVKLLKLGIKYEDAPWYMKGLGLDAEEAHALAAKIYVNQGGMPEDASTDDVPHETVGDLTQNADALVEEQGKPFSTQLQHFYVECEELAEALAQLGPIERQNIEVEAARWKTIQSGGERPKTPAEIEAAEKDPENVLYGVAGEMVDPLVAALVVVHQFGSRAGAAVIASTARLLREEREAEKAAKEGSAGKTGAKPAETVESAREEVS